MTEELETRPTPEGQAAVAAALEAITKRSFSGRHPELGKMINCAVCELRHHQNELACVQVFAKIGQVEQIAGQTKSTEPDVTVESEIGRKKIRVAVGANFFKGKRLNPHPNKRKLQFVDLVRKLIEDGYTEDELKKARKIAGQILVLRWGRYHFIPPVGAKKEEHV